jgi:hypothetical protein
MENILGDRDGEINPADGFDCEIKPGRRILAF